MKNIHFSRHIPGTECLGHRIYVFLHLEDKARLLSKVFVLYILTRNVWQFLLHYIFIPLSIVRLTKKIVNLLTYNCIKLWFFLVFLGLVKLSIYHMFINHVNFLFSEVPLYSFAHFCWVLCLYHLHALFTDLGSLEVLWY